MTPNNLPLQPTSFVGREDELTEIANLLATSACRLLTLTGPGGIGKTRLALEAARLQLDAFENGVYFAGLQALTSPDFIVPTIGDALKFTFYGEGDLKIQLLRYLRDKRLLLVLDNFEHLLEGADLLPEILKTAPGVMLLVTSRERLRLREEWMFDVRGLTFPEQDISASPQHSSAAELFTQHARRAGYVLQAIETSSVIRICQIVEGFPLALELAAAWTRVLPCHQIADEIELGLGILETRLRNVPEKHRSMHAAFEHSWHLLTDEEQAAFRGLSAFRGGCTREAAEQVAGASLRVLASLVDKSLLRVEATGRYDLHELLRQYGQEKLNEAGEAKAIFDQHRDYFLDFAERAWLENFGDNQIEWTIRVRLEHNNLLAAIGWSLKSRDSISGLRLIVALENYWYTFGYLREGYKRLNELLSQPEAKVRTPIRSKGLYTAGNMQVYEGNCVEARSLFEEAVAIAREVDDPQLLAQTDRSLGYTLYCLGEYEAASLLLEESLTLMRTLGDRFGIAWSLMFLGDVVLEQGNKERAGSLYRESVELFRVVGDKWLLVYPLRRLGMMLREYRDYERAKALCQESLERTFILGARRDMAMNLVGLAGIASAQGNAIYATQLLAAANRLLSEVDGQMLLLDQREYQRHLDDARTRLDTATFERTWAEGQAMTMEQAVDYALHGGEPEIAQPPKQSLTNPLTERELEILRLLADGHSTREVAEELFLSTGTVRWYLNQIYNKLSVHSRVQALRRVRELKLLA